jgi:2'-hydroxyisoflavone reductase
VQDWVELPLWLSSERNMPGFLNVSTEKAWRSGLNPRSLADTIADILEWDAQRVDIPSQVGLSREKEKMLLDLWKID